MTVSDFNFNPRTPVGCDYGTRYNTVYSLLFQSTHPSGVRRHRRARATAHGQISIHAPQWGATTAPPPTVTIRWHFNPRTPVGCDSSGSPSPIHLFIFQSTHPSGVRPGVAWVGVPRRGISIHAPQWGATERFSVRAKLAEFQSTHPSGVRPTRPYKSRPVVGFQSTHPSGVRPEPVRWPDCRCSNFNPRTPVGCDGHQIIPVRRRVISIHAPQWGATARRFQGSGFWRYFNPRTPVGCDGQPVFFGIQHQSISIHAPQWGATGRLRRHGTHRRISIHAPQWGATIFWFAPSRPPNEFQSTHPSGVRLLFRSAPASRRHISIHAPQWGATILPYKIQGLTQDFNPRTPVGCDMTSCRLIRCSCNFNPRTPVGCDRR